jgi:hypothetical protein
MCSPSRPISLRYSACKKLPWRQVTEHSTVALGHGRRVRRTIKVVATPAWITFAGALQVAQIRRTTTRTVDGRRKETSRSST